MITYFVYIYISSGHINQEIYAWARIGKNARQTVNNCVRFARARVLFLYGTARQCKSDGRCWCRVVWSVERRGRLAWGQSSGHHMAEREGEESLAGWQWWVVTQQSRAKMLCSSGRLRLLWMHMHEVLTRALGRDAEAGLRPCPLAPDLCFCLSH